MQFFSKIKNKLFSDNLSPDLINLRNYIFEKENFPININNRNEALIHMGIAHTGQNTQLDFFKKVFPNNMFIFGTTPEIKKNNLRYEKLEAKHKIKLFHVHACCPVHRLIEFKTKYISFLRNPISCLLSTIYSSIRMKNNQEIPQDKKKIEDSIHWHLDNAFGLKGNKQRYLLLSRFFLCFYDRVFENISVWPPKNLEPGGKYDNQSSTEIISKVKDIIDEFFPFIGITEKFDMSTFIFLSLIGYRENTNHKWKHLHVSGAPHYTELSDSVIDRISEILSIDIEIYNFYLSIFNNKYQNYLHKLSNLGYSSLERKKLITKELV